MSNMQKQTEAQRSAICPRCQAENVVQQPGHAVACYHCRNVFHPGPSVDAVALTAVPPPATAPQAIVTVKVQQASRLIDSGEDKQRLTYIAFSASIAWVFAILGARARHRGLMFVPNLWGMGWESTSLGAWADHTTMAHVGQAFIAFTAIEIAALSVVLLVVVYISFGAATTAQRKPAVSGLLVPTVTALIGGLAGWATFMIALYEVTEEFFGVNFYPDYALVLQMVNTVILLPLAYTWEVALRKSLRDAARARH